MSGLYRPARALYLSDRRNLSRNVTGSWVRFGHGSLQRAVLEGRQTGSTACFNYVYFHWGCVHRICSGRPPCGTTLLWSSYTLPAEHCWLPSAGSWSGGSAACDRMWSIARWERGWGCGTSGCTRGCAGRRWSLPMSPAWAWPSSSPCCLDPEPVSGHCPQKHKCTTWLCYLT